MYAQLALRYCGVRRQDDKMLNAKCPKCESRFGKPVKENSLICCPNCNIELQHSKNHKISKNLFIVLSILFITINETKLWPSEIIQNLFIIIWVVSIGVFVKFKNSYELENPTDS